MQHYNQYSLCTKYIFNIFIVLLGLSSSSFSRYASQDDSFYSTQLSVLGELFYCAVTVDSTSELPAFRASSDAAQSSSASNNIVSSKVCAGNVDAVVSQVGVVDPNNVIGTPDDLGAQLYDDTDTLVLDLTDQLLAGETYTIRWRRKTSYTLGPYADMILEESADGINWTTHPIKPSTNQQVYDNTNIIANIDTRFIRISPETPSNDDFDLDAVSYENVQCGCSGHADAVDPSSSGIVNADNTLAAPDGNFALVHDLSDRLVLDLTDVIAAGQSYTVTWRRKSTYTSTATADMVIEESEDLTEWTTNSFIASTSENTNFVNTDIVAEVDTRYIRLRQQTASNDDFDFDAVTYTQVNCNLVQPGDFVMGNITCSPSSTEISGVVFQDYNYNGLRDRGETIGVEQVMVRLTAADGTTDTRNTDANGQYSFAGLTAGDTYRVTFSNFPARMQPTTYNGDNGTTVQFVTTGQCANLGLSDPIDYCQENPKVSVPCYENGSNRNNTNPIIVRIDYNDSHSGQNEYFVDGSAERIGSVYGVAYDRNTQFAYYSAFLKRHAGIGSRGYDGIYVADTRTASPTVVGGFNLTGVLPANGGPALQFGTVTRTNLDGTGDGTGVNDLTANRDASSRDSDAYGKVAKVSYGDIDIDEENQVLWAVNLFERSLIAIDISTNLHQTSIPNVIDGAKVNRYFIDSATSPSISGLPNCIDGVMRPFGLTIHKGKGFLGVVCDGSALSQVDMSSNQSAYVLSFDLNNPTSFNVELSFPLNYNREQSWTPFNPSETFDALDSDDWQRWHDVFVEPSGNGDSANNDTDEIKTGINGLFLGAPQPILADIEFLPNGNMVIGLADRFAHQHGARNFTPNTTTLTRDAISHGDVLLAYYDGTGYVLEGPNENDNFDVPNVPTVVQAGLELDDGPSGTGEFFYKDYFIGVDAVHAETALGALGYLPGREEVIVISFDPNDFYSQGIRFMDENTGNQTDFYTIVANTGLSNFGKGAGLGDVEIFCDPAPIQIGNYVWIDTNKNGTQDADEVGMPNVIMELYSATGDLLATTTTDANGQYTFTGDGLDQANWVVSTSIQPNTSYYIVAGGGSQYGTQGLSVNGQHYMLTANNAATGADASSIDSDGTIASGVDDNIDGKPYISLSTSAHGNVNHTLDFGWILPCQIDITSIRSQNCNGNEPYMAEWQVIISYIGEPMGNIILQRNSLVPISFSPSTSPDTIIVTGVEADGGVQDTISVFFENENSCATTSTIKRPVPCPSPIVIPTGDICTSIANNEIGGAVFQDWDYDGSMSGFDTVGVQGIRVDAYDCSNALVSTTYTDQNGHYVFSNLSVGATYRIMFTLPERVACWAKPTQAGTDNGTSVQFVQAGDCAHLGIADPADYCDTSTPNIVTTCFVGGNPLGSGTSATGDVIVSFPYDSQGSSTADNKYLAVNSEMGAVWGIALQRKQKRLFASAMMKRHAGFGALGIGGIYEVDYTDPNNPQAANWLDLNTLTDVGSNPRTAPLPDNAGASSTDPEAFDAVGKIGIGDIDISTNEDTLYVINLHNNGSLLKIDIGNKNLVEEIPITNPGCGSDSDVRPWGITVYRGDVYVGLVCSGEQAGGDDLQFFVQRLTGTSWGTVLSGALDYDKGNVHNDFPNLCNNWETWTDTFDEIHQIGSSNLGPRWCRPQAILASMSFDEYGDLYLGFMDRVGHQTGYIQSDVAGTENGNGYVGGDVLKAHNDNGLLVLESNGQARTTGCGVGNGQGPGGGEFFCQENLIFDNNNNGNEEEIHQEIISGGLGYLLGSRQVIGNVMDPITVFSGGTIWMNADAGVRTQTYQVFNSSQNNGGESEEGTFGKAAGLGDIETFCEVAPLEIGNYVWLDDNNNGIQDACETGIDNVTVELLKAGNVIATTQTTNGGLYYFSNKNATDPNLSWVGTASDTTLLPYTNYTVRIAAVTGNNRQSALNRLQLTVTNVDMNAQDFVDSDAILTGNDATTTFTTGDYGCNDHSLDFGFTSMCPTTVCMPISIIIRRESVK